MKRYLISAVAILGILLPLVLSTLDIITSRTLFFLLGGVFGGIGLLILVGKQYYLVAGIPIRGGIYSEIPERKGRVAGGVTLGLGVLLLVLGFVNL